MNPLTLGMDALLAALLIAAVVTGVRLSGRLKALRDGQAGFATAVADLDAAAVKADRALKSLHAACESAHDDLLARIEAARALALKLEKATDAAGKAAVRAEEAAGRAAQAGYAPPQPSYPSAPAYAPAPAYGSPPPYAHTMTPPAPLPAPQTFPSQATAPSRRSLSELLAAREHRETREPLREAAPRAALRDVEQRPARPAEAWPSPEPAPAARRRLTADEDLFGDDEEELQPVRGRLGPLSMGRGR